MIKDSEVSGYRRMLKATSAIAGTRVVVIGISIIRSKVLAMLLGPAGMGVINLVTSAVEFARVVTGMGLDGATVRKIVEATSKNDGEALERAYRVAARTAAGIGLIAWGCVSVASPWLSMGAFSTPSQFWLFMLGGASLVTTPLLGVQLAFLQGLRLVKMLSICQLLTSVVGSAVTIGAVWLLGAYGGVLVLLPISITSLCIHRYFVAGRRPDAAKALFIDYRSEIVSNLKVGSGFAINAIWLTASTWLNLLFIRHFYGDQGTFFVGLYTAAATLSNFYVGIIVSALSTEFYPALSSVADEPVAMRRLLNQQTTLAIAAGVPCTLAALILAPYLLRILYSSEFTDGAALMRCLLAGMALRFVTCPLGFVMLARRATRAVVWSELLVGTTMIGTSLVFLRLYGLIGLGIALIVTNFLHLAGLALVTRRMGVYFSRKIFSVILETFAVLALCLAITLKFSGMEGMAVGGSLLFLYGLHMLLLVSKESGVSIGGLFRKIRNRG